MGRIRQRAPAIPQRFERTESGEWGSRRDGGHRRPATLDIYSAPHAPYITSVLWRRRGPQSLSLAARACGWVECAFVWVELDRGGEAQGAKASPLRQRFAAAAYASSH